MCRWEAVGGRRLRRSDASRAPSKCVSQGGVELARPSGRGGSSGNATTIADPLSNRPDGNEETTRDDDVERKDLAASDLAARDSEADRAPQIGDILTARFRYRLTKRLGSGAFGSVFLAECLDSHSGRSGDSGDTPPPLVAVKVLGGVDAPSARSSLKRELAALRAIQAPQIPKLFDWALDADVTFSVVEYFRGGSLADSWPKIDRIDAEQVWRLMSDLLSALNAAHRASILHLDVKPSNVLLDDNGGYVLTDFGVSHASRMSRGLLHQGQISVGLGTHGYRAPEQDSREVQSFDLRTDLWGVGATAWAAYTGIDLNKRADVLRREKDGNIFGLRRLSDVRLNCPPPLEEVVMGLLYIDPTRRPGGAGEVLSGVRAIASGFGLDGQTVTALRREDTDAASINAVIESLVDPLWASICKAPGFERYFVKFEDGDVLSEVGETAHQTFLLVKGQIAIERDGQLIHVEDREGQLMSAISTLTGAPRTVTMRARGTAWVCVFNEAELEQLVTCNSSIAVRMIRMMATRIVDGPPR
jgi:serine/threonine protein kinase